MKLRFAVDQAECFRKGIDCPTSIVTIEVTPAEISQGIRDLIADRMSGIDVVNLRVFQGKREQSVRIPPDHVVATSPDFEGLTDAVRRNEGALRQEISQSQEV